jgi:hypothetical protein
MGWSGENPSVTGRQFFDCPKLLFIDAPNRFAINFNKLFIRKDYEKLVLKMQII